MEEHKSQRIILTQQTPQLTMRGQRLDDELHNCTKELRKLQQKRHDVDSERKKLHQLELEINEKLESTLNNLMQAKSDRNESNRSKKFKETLETLSRLFPGIHGRILDLCKPTQRKYDLAVSIILGKNMDAIGKLFPFHILVVDTEKAALECIKYMREHRCGTATFLPLDTIQTKPINEKYRTFVKGARLVIDAIQFEPSCERAILYAVGNALIADTMEVARHICYEKQQDVKVVTIEGTIIHKTGNITGGFLETSSAKRWEEKELETLQQKRISLEEQLADIQKQKRKVDHDDGLISQLTQLESKYQEVQDDIDANKQQLVSNEREIQHLDTLIAGLERNIMKEKIPLKKLNDQIKALDDVVYQCQNDVFKDFCVDIGVADIREYEKGRLSATLVNSQKRLEYVTKKAKIENLLVYEKEQLNETNSRKEKIEFKINEINESLNNAESEKRAVEDENQNYEDQITEITKDLENAKDKLAEQGSIYSLTVIVRLLSEIKKRQVEFHNSFDSVAKTIGRKEGEIETLSAQKMAILRRCKLEEINIPLEDGLELSEISLEKLQDPNAMDVDEEEESNTESMSKIRIDYSDLKKTFLKV